MPQDKSSAVMSRATRKKGGPRQAAMKNGPRPRRFHNPLPEKVPVDGTFSNCGSFSIRQHNITGRVMSSHRRHGSATASLSWASDVAATRFVFEDIYPSIE